jgi:phosphopentomutase
MTEYLYRLEFMLTSNGVDEYDEPYPGHGITLHMKRFDIIRRTPKGAWISRFFNWPVDRDKFVLLTARKQYASETEEKAVRQFLRRKERHRSILISQISDIDKAIALASNYKDKWNEKNISTRSTFT